jgi:hypothetical protein
MESDVLITTYLESDVYGNEMGGMEDNREEMEDGDDDHNNEL